MLNTGPKYEYIFHEKGSNASDVPEGHIWLDVGNALMPGVIDHHSVVGYSCAVEALQKNLHLLDGLKDRARIVVHTHKHPDTDALFSICLVRHYLEKGNNYTLPENMDAIVEYVSKIDSGHVEVADKPTTLYMVLCYLTERYWDEAELEKCLSIIGAAIEKNAEHGFAFMDDDIQELEGLEGFGQLREQILSDNDRYKDDKKKICREAQITLPMSGNPTIASVKKVRALIWTRQPTCKFNRLWARSDDYALTVVPQADKSYSFDDRTIVCTDTIISLAPELASEYSLRPLAYLLEQYEQTKERLILGDANNTKRDHSRPRGKKEDGSRFFEKPWSLTADPWYFTEDGTLVQSPNNGSLLNQREVSHIVETFGECCIKEYRMNILVPFTYDPTSYNAVLQSFEDQGWKKGEIPWLDEKKRYVSTFLHEYSFVDESERHFQVLTRPFTRDFFQNAGCALHTDACVFHEQYTFDTPLTCVLFKYGAGIAIFSHAANQIGKRILASFEVEKLNTCQNTFIDHFEKCPLFSSVPVSCLTPHFYTSIEVSSECLNMSNSLVSKFAVSMCDMFDNSSGFCATQKINYRTVMAHSRLGSALVIATDDFDKFSSNKDEYYYRDRFAAEWFYMYLIALQQRYSLVEIKRNFTSLLGANNCLDTKKLREKLIEFYASSYFTTVTDDELGDCIYGHWHKILMIDDLKTLIMEEVNQHDEYMSNKATALFDKISNWLIPLLVVSSLIQVFVNWHSAVGIFQSGESVSLAEWLPVLASVGLIMLIIWLRNLRK